jgi:hypothetical protein
MRMLLFLFIPVVIFFASCSTPKKIQSTNSLPAKNLKKENKYFLMSKLKANNFNFRWISAHFNADIYNDTAQDSFSGVVRIRKDSAIWMTISVILGAYTALHAKLGVDSVMYIDHHDKQYFKGNYDYIDTLLQEDIDYDLIQSVMIGTSLEFYNDTAKMNAYFDGTDYILSTVRKRRLRRIESNKFLHTKNDAQLIWIDPTDFHIKKVRLEDFVTHHTFEATYEDFQKADSGVSFPRHIHYEINTGKKIIKIDLNYKKINFTDYEKIPFIIPKNYEQIHY